ncbi:MAG: hypothetical protein A2167_05225 [Planctomycetes bacterium RBG_13_46_10]|nr:MAG: hypothetical protein A2167_05225 [Planctomycetes bacterium RBG_13_46_10]
MAEYVEYKREIKGEYDLEQINLEISTEEARGTEFLRSIISSYKERITNIADFKRLPPGELLKEITLVKQGGAKPPNTAHVWSGVMIVSNKAEAIEAYRAT